MNRDDWGGFFDFSSDLHMKMSKILQEKHSMEKLVQQQTENITKLKAEIEQLKKQVKS